MHVIIKLKDIKSRLKSLEEAMTDDGLESYADEINEIKSNVDSLIYFINNNKKKE